MQRSQYVFGLHVYIFSILVKVHKPVACELFLAPVKINVSARKRYRDYLIDFGNVVYSKCERAR